MNESAASRAREFWARSRDTRSRIALWLAIPGALVWTVQALGAWIQSQEGKWQDNEYLSIGSAAIHADTLLTFLACAFLLIAVLLGTGAVLLLRADPLGRYLLLAGAGLVTVGQLFAAVLAEIPIDAFYYSPPANLVFSTILVVFPLSTIICLTDDRPRRSGA
ncbi:hypothetical protein H0264_32730 [Nocardia huaxiensis]|uniref:Uncharacterized protein n=1 Tax=Nocardia huaxiensis TaxID=2755382 RepID=A0A7D6VAZ5_9NOCA|nr:hypothetical protein [Nocardia huaxiensis]QLY29922.1 hypothetical protein H0264_32730 [Nocardia huaxiensis]